MKHPYSGIDYSEIEKTLHDISCPVCSEFADDLHIEFHVLTATVSCSHDGFIKKLRNEYSRLMEQQAVLITAH